MPEIDRFIEDRIVQALHTFPVVYIAGPRQSGKSTLTQRIAATRHKARYLTFDDLQIRAAAERDPMVFLQSLGGPVVLDEIQMAPELFRPLKMIVDENRQRADGGRGQFLLTGSASVMALPQLSDALVGRMALYNLLPFSTQEIQQIKQPTFIENIFSTEWSFAQFHNDDLMQMMLKASYPELLTLENNSLRYEWCNGYINTILQRDVRVLMEVEKIAALPDLLRLFATRTGGLLNEASLSRDTGLNHITAKRYRLLLESLFLLQSVPAWSSNLGKRLIKAPKLYIGDMNVLAYLLNVDLRDLPKENPMLFGAVLENFVAIELAKQITFSAIPAKLYHYRTASGQEVDFILEGPQNHIVGIEVKTKSKLSGKDFQHLEVLQNELGKRFRRGIVLYQGKDLMSFGKDLWAVPMRMLWSHG
ncbi:MAG: ATP-binding protein [Gammaproteobacteria bacterium]|nr:ATP-binding protein [Gammaproteobacteria bacterium]